MGYITKAGAQRIQALANDAIEAARKEKGHIYGAINWGDLKCIDVLQSLLLDSPTPIVVIEEASPAAIELQEFVARYINAHGFIVEVSTEW